MDSVLLFLQNNFPFIIEHKYLFILLGASIDGTNSAILAGFLASVNTVSLPLVFLLCLLGEVINGYVWYSVGYFAGSKPIDKWGRKDKKSRKIIEKVEEYFKKYSGRAILIAKLTWSLTIASEITAGSLKYDLKKFSLYNVLGSLGWVTMTISVGYFFGQSYKFFFDYIKNIFYILLFLGGAIAIGYTLRMIFRSVFIRSLLITETLKNLGDKITEGVDKLLSNDLEDTTKTKK